MIPALIPCGVKIVCTIKITDLAQRASAIWTVITLAIATKYARIFQEIRKDEYMNKDKQIEETYIVNNEQIEEMANFLWKNTLIHTEDLCHDVSETLYNAGYRKQSENMVEVVRCKDCVYKVVTVDVGYDPHDIVCNFHASDGFDETDFCSFGKMKGGAE